MANNESQGPRRRVQMQMQPSEPAEPPISPSQEISKRASKTVAVVDARGRQIVLRKPTPLAQFRFVEMLGASANNERYFAMAFPILLVIKIDDEDVPAPVKKSELEALIKLLDEDGLAAIAEAVQKHFAEQTSESEFREEVKS